MLLVTKPGLQTTLQGAPRIGYRHYGIPYSGAADALSQALANRLVGNAATETVLEITYGGFEAEVTAACTIAVAGACDLITISGEAVSAHTSLHLSSGDRIEIAPLRHGMRTYLAIRSGFAATEAFGSSSTYLPAGFGGLDGRALRAGDQLAPKGDANFQQTLETPPTHRPAFSSAIALRACASAETDTLSRANRETLFMETFMADRQATRMGIGLTGHTVTPNSDGKMKSAPVFPGTVQCPPSGAPVILLCDAQTTGGYPRIASIARCDRHLLGQIRPGNHVQLLERSADAALQDLVEKQKLLSDWLDA